MTFGKAVKDLRAIIHAASPPLKIAAQRLLDDIVKNADSPPIPEDAPESGRKSKPQ